MLKFAEVSKTLNNNFSFILVAYNQLAKDLLYLLCLIYKLLSILHSILVIEKISKLVSLINVYSLPFSILLAVLIVH